MSPAINSGPTIHAPLIQYLPGFGNRVAVLRLDQVHPVVSGNKWYKLQGHLAEAAATGKQTLLTFGGAYSNHIVATAAACKAAGLAAIGIIRGEAPQQWSPTLVDAKNFGMHLYFISRTAYRDRLIPPEVYRQQEATDIYIIEEGGAGIRGTRGITELMQTGIAAPFTHILCAVGTGTTLAGLIQGSRTDQHVLGISALKNNTALEDAVRSMLINPGKTNWQINHTYHFGGYARHKPELLAFMNAWYQKTNVPSDFVYTGKLFFAFQDLWKQHFFEAATKVLLVHTGGLQGNRSLPAGTLLF